MEFAEMLIMILGTVDYDVREGITRTLVLLLKPLPSKLTTVAHDALITALNGPAPPSQKDKQQESFIRTALWALKELMPDSEQLLVELMSQYLQSDILLRNTIKGLFNDLGLLDPHNYFETELNSWLDSDALSDSTKDELWDLSNNWMRKWTGKFKEHIRSAMKSLKKGKTLRGSLPIPQSPSPSGRSPAVLPSNLNKATIVIPEKLQAGNLMQLNPIEAVNYFCELQLQEKLKEMMAAESQEAVEKQNDRSNLKNTVLFLPKDQRERAILRLGETTVTEAPLEKFHLPPIAPGSLSFGLGQFIKLAVPKINLNPFPSPIDRYPLQQVLITLRHSPQKHFILERSYVSNYG
ncbi:WD repeat-containing protein 97 [Mustelus asterias]